VRCLLCPKRDRVCLPVQAACTWVRVYLHHSQRFQLFNSLSFISNGGVNALEPSRPCRANRPSVAASCDVHSSARASSLAPW